MENNIKKILGRYFSNYSIFITILIILVAFKDMYFLSFIRDRSLDTSSYLSLIQFISNTPGIMFGILIAYLLTEATKERQERKRKEKVYKSLFDAFKIELENNERLIKESKWSAVSFEIFKLVSGNEIFIDGLMRDEKFGEPFLKEAWGIISELRQAKNSHSGVDARDYTYIEDGRFKKFQEFKDKLNKN